MQGKDLSEAVANRQAIDHIKSLYLRNIISREVAEIIARPVIAHINEKQQAVAKRHHRSSYPKTTFAALMR